MTTDIARISRRFHSLRSNLALCSSFIKVDDLDDVRSELDEYSLKLQKECLTTIQTALAFQCLDDYFKLVMLDPQLKDRNINRYIDGLGSRSTVARGMKTFRNSIFHVFKFEEMSRADLQFIEHLRTIYPGMIDNLIRLLYGFTDRCLTGEPPLFE